MFPLTVDLGISESTGKPESLVTGVLEITQDITDDYDSVVRFQWLILATCLGSSTILFAILQFFIIKAERTLAERMSRNRKLEAELHQNEKLASMGRVIASIAHEIRNPLSSIKGLAKYFAERTPPGGESHQLAQVMAKEADRLNRVVSELLELVRPAHLNYQPVDINALIHHSLQLVSQDAQSRGIALQFTPRPELSTINADADRLNQVLLNLYLNAMQAIGRDGVIHVSASEADRRRMKIVVKDSGKGMSDEELQAIFTPYFTTKADGTGLGLAVVQNIIEQHGGTIRAESQPGAGAIFTLWLPLDAQRREDEQR